MTWPAPPRQIRVLLVDDSPDLCDLIETAAREELDMRCSVALSTLGLAKVIDIWQPDILVMDLTIPGESPLAVMRALSASHPDLRIIVYSGTCNDKVVDDAFDAGGWGVVSKGDDPHILFSTIRRIVAAGPSTS